MEIIKDVWSAVIKDNRILSVHRDSEEACRRCSKVSADRVERVQVVITRIVTR